MSTIIELEHQRRGQVAQGYRDKGYNVVIEPRDDQLPAFLAGTTIDILAQTADENIVIAVKSRPSLINNQAIPRLAQLNTDHPGWRFNLIVVGLPDDYSISNETPLLTRNEINTRNNQVEQIIQINALEAALLFAWATTEALFRLLAEYDQVELRRRDPRYLISQLTTYGILSREEYQFFTTILEVRNTIAHGYPSAELSPQLVRKLTERASHLLEINHAPVLA